MFLEMRDFGFAQIQSHLPEFNHFCPNFVSNLPKPNQVCPNLASSCSKKFARRYIDASPAFPAPTALIMYSSKMTAMGVFLNTRSHLDSQS